MNESRISSIICTISWPFLIFAFLGEPVAPVDVNSSNFQNILIFQVILELHLLEQILNLPNLGELQEQQKFLPHHHDQARPKLQRDLFLFARLESTKIP